MQFQRVLLSEQESRKEEEGILLTAPSLVIDRSERASRMAAGCLPGCAKYSSA